MSLRILASGTLRDDPTPRTSASGKSFTTARIRTTDKDDGVIWCSIIAFNEQAERLGSLRAGTTVAVTGRAGLKTWQGKDGVPHVSADLVCDELIVLQAKPRPKEREPREPETAMANAPFDDFDDWKS